MWLLRLHCVIYRFVSSVNLPSGHHYKTTTAAATTTTIPYEVLCVVPQGSVLRPLHFIAVWCGLLVADYIILLRAIVSSWEFVTAVGLSRVRRWWIYNFMQLVKKTRVISFYPLSPTCSVLITNFVNPDGIIGLGSPNCISTIKLITYFLRQSGCWG